MAAAGVPTVNNAAASPGATPAAGLLTSGETSSAPAAGLFFDASTQAATGSSSLPAMSSATMPPQSGLQTGALNPTAGNPPPSFDAGEFNLASGPAANWQAADFIGAGQSSIWGPAPSAAWSAASGADYSSAGYSDPSAYTFIGDSSMADTLWYDASGGTVDDSQIASGQSPADADFGDQFADTGTGVVSGNGGGGQWLTV